MGWHTADCSFGRHGRQSMGCDSRCWERNCWKLAGRRRLAREGMYGGGRACPESTVRLDEGFMQEGRCGRGGEQLCSEFTKLLKVET